MSLVLTTVNTYDFVRDGDDWYADVALLSDGEGMIVQRGYPQIVPPTGDSLMWVVKAGYDRGYMATPDVQEAFTSAERLRIGACRLCGKLPSQPHTAETRTVHSDHMTRYGWSGMCVSPRVP